MSERTPAQRARDDEDHRLALCGLLPDERDEHELEDREYQYHDFVFAHIRSSWRCANAPTSDLSHAPAGGGFLRPGRAGGGASGSPILPRGTAGPAEIEEWEMFAWRID